MRKNKQYKYNTHVKQTDVDKIRFCCSERYHLMLEGETFRGQRWYGNRADGIQDTREKAADYSLTFVMRMAKSLDETSGGRVKCTIMPAWGEALDLAYIVHRKLRRGEPNQKTLYFS